MSLGAPLADFPKLDKFELCEEIGHGGMATVYRARDPRLKREVAVKIIHRHLRDNPEVATRFVAEARAAAKLKHRGIVEVYDVSSEEDREKYLVVELIRGCTLRKTLQDHREMPAEIGAAIVAELCDAVDHAHAAGIIHRDIKPENVLIELPGDRKKAARDGDGDLEATSGATPVGMRVQTEEDRARDAEADGETSDVVSARPTSSGRGSSRGKERKAQASKGEPPRSSDPSPTRSPKSARSEREVIIKLTDFGIAKVLDAQSVTSTGQVLGSPAHMAPEQIEGGEIDARTDVFALGVLLYECMVGHLPFEGKNPAQVLRRVIEGTFSPAELERPSVGGRFSLIVASALAILPDDRPHTPQLLAEALRKELTDLGLSDTRTEIASYFADPDDYRAKLPGRIVPRLVARGEESRKARRVQLAASDFNRAHALSPDDPAILRRITNLSSSEGRERMLRRVAVMTLGAMALCGSTYAVVRVVRVQSAKNAATSSPSAPLPSATGPEPVVKLNDLPTAPPHVLPSAIPSKIKVALQPKASGEPTAIGPQPLRPVTFVISPMGAHLQLDGSDVDWMGKTYSLSPGNHPYKLSPPGESECCDSVSGMTTVAPAPKDNPNETQRIWLGLKIRPASLRITGGPSGMSVACGALSVSVGVAQEVKLSSVDQTFTCIFPLEQGPKKVSVRLTAGTTTNLAWPSGG